jgi:hypothetical protein
VAICAVSILNRHILIKCGIVWEDEKIPGRGSKEELFEKTKEGD